ncbi:multidrug efflux RND transporter permease subunit [Aestuariicella hydrocarbonica]|uniref:Efflux pump membrane transporter n=1 Tax=Pseudomaricurvus hydrocarbonicus TaxID=1470433 RepID=A0A9E5T4N0_9GAMM|nr:multidrug efflux RND transporter permease subunit [Aestuariicella hydrocarbonica]NHO68147.1 multidrug efflux RND transporter permease subunit [Aestuariicella hydrocarbonica]
MGPQFFIKRPRFAFVISILITIFGLLAAIVMPVDQYPEIAPPKVRVFANYPGASAETVKETVAGPIEDQVNGAEGMIYMQSNSASDGSYTLQVTFETGVDASLAQVDIQNRVALAEPRLPAEVLKRGIKVRKTSSDMLMVVSLFSPDDTVDGVYLSNYTSLNVLPEIARLDGVGDARIIGALNYGMRLWLDPVKLANNKISVSQVLAALQEQNVQAAVGQLGAAPSPPQTQFQYVLKTKGRLVSEEEFGNIILRSDPLGSILRLKDVARLELGSEVYKGFGEYNNKPGVLLAVYKLSDANSLEVAESVRTKMDELSQFFPDGVGHIIGHDTTLFIEASLEETVLTLFFTIALVIFVTYLFLGSVRATLVPTIAVPVSIIGTLAVLQLLGLTINTVTLFALILAIGLVVDDAIIVVENVERLMHDEGLEARPATQQAMREVAAPIFATSTVLLAVFGPTLLLPGITGEMFAQFGITLVVAVIISMINALSLSPALCSLLLKQSHHKPNPLIRGFNAVFSSITRGYVNLVGWLASHLLISSLLIVALFAGLVFLFTLVPTSFIPEEDKGFFMVEVQLPPAASLNRTSDYVDKLYATLENDPAIETILSVNGFSILNAALQPNAGMIIVKLKPWGERTAPDQHQFALQQKYKALFSQIPGGRVTVFGAPALPGMGAVAGFSYVLEDTQSQGAQNMARALGKLIGDMNGLPEVSVAFSTFRADYPQIELTIDRIKAKTLGVSISDIFLTLQTQLGGYYVNDFNLYGKTYRVMVQADSQFRQTENDLANLYVANAQGEMVSMRTFVSTSLVQGADILYRYNTYDSAIINGRPNDAGGYSSGETMAAIDTLSFDSLPSGFRYDWTGSSFEERKSGNMAPIAMGLSLLFTYLFLAALYESMITPISIILSVPVAMIGALIGMLITGESLSLYGQIGLVLLIGMSAKTAILIVEFAKSLREAENRGLHEATVEAARLRFRPVTMTALSFLVGVFPLVIASGAGSAARVSLGLSIFGGTIAGVIGGTLLVPVFFKIFQTLREKVHGGKTNAPE